MEKRFKNAHMHRISLSPFRSKNIVSTSKFFILFTPYRNKSRSCLSECESIVPVMGWFYMAKAAMGCLEKHLQECDTEGALTELGALGQKAVFGTTMYAVHYVG